MDFRPLPIGIDNFKKIIDGKYYFIDKTWLIKELLDKKSAVTLFTRPRRFGKTLNMSMIQYFLEDTGNAERNAENKKMFYGLKIMDAGESCAAHMGKYPVISLSLKSAKQPSYSSAYYKICEELWREYDRHCYVLDYLTGSKREQFQAVLDRKASADVYSGALKFLCEVLHDYHKTSVVILIDEYDVPLENAYYCGFYDEMAGFIRSLFESALKTNVSMEFAVITECLRISRESIFTGLNNLNMISILSSRFDEYFGFRPDEVSSLLSYYRLEKYTDIVKRWYDGYMFGEANVYNPWSVINYVSEAASGSQVFPRPYWSNTSSNSIVRDLIDHADASAKEEVEKLIAGKTIEKPVHEDITYDSIYDSNDNLWNFLFFTGYLKLVSQRMEGRDLMVTMAIPNEEVAYIYDNTIKNWFHDEIKTKDLTVMYQAMLTGNPDVFQKELSVLLQSSISFLDSREAFYHGFLLGVLGNMREYLVKSNRESGNGRLDIIVRSLDVSHLPVILELKVSETFKDMDNACDEALKQIKNMKYDAWLPEEGYSGVWNYGIAFFRKQCRIKASFKKF